MIESMSVRQMGHLVSLPSCEQPLQRHICLQGRSKVVRSWTRQMQHILASILFLLSMFALSASILNSSSLLCLTLNRLVSIEAATNKRSERCQILTSRQRSSAASLFLTFEFLQNALRG